MLEEGKISSEEAARLLEALDGSRERQPDSEPGPEGIARAISIMVISVTVVQITLITARPISMRKSKRQGRGSTNGRTTSTRNTARRTLTT